MEETGNNREIFEDHKQLAKSSIYSLLNNYGIFVFQIVISIFIANLISQTLWSYLILAMAYINIISLVLTLFPPALNLALNYYIPRYSAYGQNNRLKYMIKVALYIKTLFAIIIFLLSLLIFSLLNSLFSFFLSDYTYLLFLLSPLVIIIGLQALLDSIFQGLFNYRLIFVITVIKYAFNVTALLVCILIGAKSLEVIAYIYLISYIIPFLISLVFFLKIYFNIKHTTESTASLKKVLLKLSKYGTPLSITVFLNETWKQLQSPLIRLYEPEVIVTGFTVSKYYSQVSLTASSSFSTPLITSFSSLDAKSQQNQISQIYALVFRYSSFVLLLISGVLFILSDLFLLLAYGQSYLIHVPILQFYLLSIIFTTLGNLFVPLLNALNKVRLLPPLTIVNLVIIIASFMIGLIIGGIISAIIGLIISKFIVFLIQVVLSIKIGNIKLNLKRTTYQYLIFFIALIVAVLMEEFVFKPIRLQTLQSLHMPILNHFSLFSSLTFLIIYLVLNGAFKIFSASELEYLETLIHSKKKQSRFITIMLKLFKKILCWRS
jgi:O-antigen/teichoic acid export membrane protein